MPNSKLKVIDSRDLTVQEAWQEAADSDADVHLEGDELNAHFAYDDEDNQSAPPGVVPRRRDRPQRDAGGAADGAEVHLCFGGWARKTPRSGRCGTIQEQLRMRRII